MHQLTSILLIWICCSSSALNGQWAVSGTVRDVTGIPVEGAHVVIYSQEEAIIGFTFSDSLGVFGLSIAAYNQGLKLKVSHLTHLSVVVSLSHQDQQIDITLEPGWHELPPVIVKVDPVIRRGDTLIFDVNSYTRADDRRLEDVLARLPGVEIEPSGKILYRGLAISKLYIEGLDMLEGRYKIATRNLALHHIKDIEVIERHQHKKVLRDMEYTNQAAINIKLEAKVAYTGSISAGIASRDSDYKLRGDIFGFTKSYQFVGLTSSNTFGLSERAALADMHYSYSLYDLPLLSINGPRIPWHVPPQNYAENNEQVIGGMGLIKLSDEDVVKLFMTYTRASLAYAGSEDIRFDLPGVPTLYQLYLYNNALKPDSWSSHAIYEKNGDRLFIKSQNAIELSHNREVGKNSYNGTPAKEDLFNRTLEGKSANEIILRFPNRTMTVYVDLSYKKQEELLSVDTIDLEIGNISRGFTDLHQSIDRNIAQGHMWTGFNWKLDKGIIGARTGILGTLDEITSSLMPEGVGITLDGSYQNNQALRQLSPYLDLLYRLDLGHRTVTVAMPMRWLIYNLQDNIRKTEASARPFLYSFNAGYFDRSSTYLNWSLDYNYRDDFQSLIRPVHAGFVLYSNRSLGQSILDFNRLYEHKMSAQTTYIHSSANKTYNIGIEYIAGTYQYMNFEQFDLMGRKDIQVARPNTQKQVALNAQSTGRLFSRMDYKLFGQFMWSQRMIGVNGQLLELSNRTDRIELSVSYRLGRSVLTFNPQWLFLNNSTTESKASQGVFRLKYYARFSNWGALRLEGGAYVNTIGTDRKWNTLFNLEWEKEWKKHRTTLTFAILNLTDTNNFITLEQYLNNQQLFTLGMRPLQVRLSCKKSW